MITFTKNGLWFLDYLVDFLAQWRETHNLLGLKDNAHLILKGVKLQFIVQCYDFGDCSYLNVNILGGFCPVSLTGRATECRDDGVWDIRSPQCFSSAFQHHFSWFWTLTLMAEMTVKWHSNSSSNVMFNRTTQETATSTIDNEFWRYCGSRLKEVITMWSPLLPWAVMSKSTVETKDKWTDKSRANEQLHNYIWRYALIRLNPFSTSYLSYRAAFLAGICRPPHPSYLPQLQLHLHLDLIPSVCPGSSSASRLGSTFLKCSSFTLSFAPFV